MNALREVIAVVVFIVAVVSLSNLVLNGFDGRLLIATVICFIAAYIIWPSKRKGARQGDNSLLDIIEFIIELPIDLFLWLFRSITRIFRSNDSHLDIDL
ncbi:hypothetical protein [Alkalimarinus coralli]|uniref:hypothetical protein n=1 Tax=Alkalimarinus coralli TaxID=2935863 RepID=UPI00202AE833|nr:hypothetical protein [Alkalimarinus coralli]